MMCLTDLIVTVFGLFLLKQRHLAATLGSLQAAHGQPAAAKRTWSSVICLDGMLMPSSSSG